MKVFSNAATFDYSWEEVSTANWRKYGEWNDKTPHVLAVDTLSRSVHPETGILRTERLITCKQSAPKWLHPFLGGQDTSQVHEISYVDPKRKTVTMVSQNMTFSSLLSVQETCIYRPSPSMPSSTPTSLLPTSPQVQPPKTLFEQKAEITALCGGWKKIKENIEQFTVERFSQNAARGREGFQRVLEISRRVFEEERRQRH